MRKLIPAFVFIMALVVACSAYAPYEEGPGAQVAVGGNIDIGFFYDYLSPWGSWVDFSPWGYVWCPAGLGFGWRPYSYGDWLWTDDGWFWDSFYEWGWGPFHYGRWGWDDGLGWFWVPGSTWGPAWVSWCWNDDYFGWAPLPPGVGFRAGFGIGSVPRIPDRYWSFVDGRHFGDRDMDRWVLPMERNRTILSSARYRGNLSVSGDRIMNRGVDLDRVERLRGDNLPRYNLRDADRPGPVRVEQQSVNVFRQPVARTTAARPRTFLRRDEAAAQAPQVRTPTGEVMPPETRTQRMQERQSHEREILQQSQEQEKQMLQQRRQEEINRAQNQNEKSRIDRQYQQRQQNLQRQHQQERNQMQQRHQQEEQKSSKAGGGAGPKKRIP